MNEALIRSRIAACGLSLPDEAAGQLDIYLDMLYDWNKRLDLTAVTEPDEMIDRHYMDSLMLLKEHQLMPAHARCIDVGTGAGFPGLPLAIARKDCSFVLMDAQQKRLDFLLAVIDTLHLSNVTLLHSRAEDGARNPALREQFDLSVARAVASLPVLCEYLLPFVRIGGCAVCWKGPGLADEAVAGKRAAYLLGGEVEDTIPYTIPGRDWNHNLQPIRKTKPTPSKYPRKAGTPAKSPLGGAIPGGKG